ncbi:MAG: hypothetical protein R3F18_16775 [Lysobacterales bacterium]|nr:hypothetical protein [Xanthomonadales bacterium]MCP5476434.1 hypothetical protein [Rhodanobacteraceae bacterium]
MIGLDTNVLARYIMQDDPGQASLADALMHSLNAEQPGFVTFDRAAARDAGMVLIG